MTRYKSSEHIYDIHWTLDVSRNINKLISSSNFCYILFIRAKLLKTNYPEVYIEIKYNQLPPIMMMV
ncbi:hypothetical protein Hanom_Chr15g01397781 [Helianthus anomalus]